MAMQNSMAPRVLSQRPSTHMNVKVHRPSLPSSPASSDCSRKAQAARDETRRCTTAWRLSLLQPSDDSNGSSGSVAVPAERWFEQSNRNVGRRLGSRILDDDPPYFLQQQGVPNGIRDGHVPVPPTSSVEWTTSQTAPEVTKAATNGSSADDFRSVIDDLTIENKRLKDRLRKYETSYGTQLEKDRLFEVKVHGLSPNKKRELEQTLHAFASSIHKDELTNASSSQPRRASKKLSPSSASNSQHVDSAYASGSATGPKSSSASNNAGPEKKNNFLISDAHSFLDDIPQGLLPKHSAMMTERSKKKLVVKRLEQLFTGKLKASGGAHPLHLQQQEKSTAAALADRQDLEKHGHPLSAEGVREANMLQTEMVLELPKSLRLPGDHGGDSSGTSQAEGERLSDPADSPDQRPTRPLDLDPDRAQVPADNIEYIRHLGVSTPLMAVEDLFDMAADNAHGWMYLNLLVNMAQLHIINVTPDFVRSAVTDLSTHFELSPDGRKIRWKGGTEGTELSSDSGADSSGAQPPTPPSDVDMHEEVHQKRRKTNAGSSQVPVTDRNASRARLSTVPIADVGYAQPVRNDARLQALRYKPIFAHRSTTEEGDMSLDDSLSSKAHAVPDDGAACRISADGKEVGWRSYSASSSKRKRNEGAMIFYTRAPFCTDLAGDRDNISTPLHVTAVGIDGFSNHTDDAIGCMPRPLACPASPPTPSGSTTPFRPFQQSFVGGADVVADALVSQPPENCEAQLNFSPRWSATGLQPQAPLLSLEASGLGGTRPADHFTVTVKTRRNKLDDKGRAPLARPAKRPIRYAVLHNKSGSSQDSPSTPDSYDNDTSPSALTPAPRNVVDVALKTEILSVHVQHLEPSNLPPPAMYGGPFSSSTGSSDGVPSDNGKEVGDENEGVTQIVQRLRLACPSYNPPSEENQDHDGSSMDDDETSSIDMLAYARERDPDTVAAREKEFEREVADLGPMLVPACRATATTDDSSVMTDSEMSED